MDGNVVRDSESRMHLADEVKSGRDLENKNYDFVLSVSENMRRD